MKKYKKIERRQKNRPIKFKRYEVTLGYFLFRSPDFYYFECGKGKNKIIKEYLYFDYLSEEDSLLLNTVYENEYKDKKNTRKNLVTLINQTKKIDLEMNVGGIVVYIPCFENLSLKFSTPVLNVEIF